MSHLLKAILFFGVASVPLAKSVAAQTDVGPINLRFAGIVLDETTGDPLAGVVVTVPGFPWRTTTDDFGYYVIEGRQPPLNRATSVEAFLPGYLPERRLLLLGCHTVVGPARTESVCDLGLSFTLQPWNGPDSASATCTISGRVLTAQGSSGVPATVIVDGLNVGTLANNTGGFKIVGVPPGLHRITVSHLGLFDHQRLVVVTCESPESGPEMEFRLNPSWIQ